MTLYYDGGKKRYDLIERLKPHAQMWVDVGKLIRESTPDKKGIVLPADLRMGSYELQDLTDKGLGNLYEGKIILDKTYGHVAYGCATCCGFRDGAYMYYDPFGIGLGLQGSQDVWAWDNCNLGNESILEYVDYKSWKTGNSSIATANRNVISGVGVGSTSDSAQATLVIGNIMSKQCPDGNVDPSGNITICPGPVPTSASTELTDPLSLSLVFPNGLTGIGDVARVTVGPSGTTWDGQNITETVALASSTCPAAFQACSGSTTFTIGLGYQPSTCTAWSGGNCTTYTPVGPLLVATTNEFFDQYTYSADQSVLDYYGGGSSCEQTCTQTYFSVCTPPLPIFTHSFTRTLTKSTIHGTKVTLVTVSE